MKEIGIVDGKQTCYTYTCKNITQGLMPSGKAEYCSECRAMIAPHEAACKEIGVESWDETFVVFREGAWAERARRAKSL